jgi:hypothetical protein
MSTTQKTSPLLIAGAWLLVILPTAWGLNFTVQNAMKIFTAKAPTAAVPATATPAPAPSK